jgi:hypothetical protein
MTNHAAEEHSQLTKWGPSVALVTALYLIYSSTFLTDYLMNDEFRNIGSGIAGLAQSAQYQFLCCGRGLFAV